MLLLIILLAAVGICFATVSILGGLTMLVNADGARRCWISMLYIMLGVAQLSLMIVVMPAPPAGAS